jgi:hypothetical protein
VVSPVLDRLAARHPELAARYPNRTVLAPEGVGNGAELFAYVRLPAARTLAGEVEDMRAQRVRAFGKPSGDEPSATYDLTSVPISGVIQGVVGFLVVPALLVLAVGLAAASELRDRRFEMLRWIGIPQRTLAALGVLETAILAVPGLAAAALLWAVVGPLLEHVPLVGRDVLRGDLGLPWWILVGCFTAGLGVAALVATVVTGILSRRAVVRSRPGVGRAVVTPLRAILLGLALGAFALSGFVGGNLAGTLAVAALVLALAGVPLVLPGVLRAVGAELGGLRSLTLSLAGRTLQWDPVRASRPFAGAAALVVLVLVGAGYVKLIRDTRATAVPEGAGPSTVAVSWYAPRSGDHGRLAAALGRGLVAPYEVTDDGSTLIVGAPCQEVARYVAGLTCNRGAPYDLPAAAALRLGDVVAALGAPGTEVRLMRADALALGGNALVLDNQPLSALDERVKVAAMSVVPVIQVVSSQTWVQGESPLVPWIVGGIVAGLVALMVGCLLSLIDRFLGTRRHRRHLLALGVAPRRLTTLEASLFAVPYGVVIAVGFAVGLALTGLMAYRTGIGMPWDAAATALAVAALVGFVGTAAVALFGVRSLRDRPRSAS